MKLYAPDYYQTFACIHQRCRHNCCIGWEIDIDRETYTRYQEVTGEFGKRLSRGICHGEEPRFRLTEGERCAFLNQDNLCDIILHLGEDSLCQICADHPRFRNFFADREELGLGLCCEAAAELILTRKAKTQLVCLSGEDEEPEIEELAFFALRERVFALLQDRRLTVRERMENLAKEYAISLPDWGYDRWAEVLKQLERLDPEWDARIAELSQRKEAPQSLDADQEIAFEQVLVYFVYRHLAEGFYDGRIRKWLAFALISTQILMGLHTGRSMQELVGLARGYSAEVEYSEENLETMVGLL